MDIFIAWSGKASEKLAKALFKWLPDVIQTIEPFMSSESIRGGQRWFGEIGARLEKTDFAILCATPANLKSTWMHFEAGAVSKNVTRSRVCALLLDVTTPNLRLRCLNSNIARSAARRLRKSWQWPGRGGAECRRIRTDEGSAPRRPNGRSDDERTDHYCRRNRYRVNA